MPNREEEYARVREILAFPKEQMPNPHQIVSELLRQEQKMVNKAGLTGRAWNTDTASITTIANQASYVVPNGKSTFGKAFFVTKNEGDSIIPVAFADFTNELHNQNYDFFVAPIDSGVFPTISGEKIAFNRTASPNEDITATIYPTPSDAGKVYNIEYGSGHLNKNNALWTDTPFLPEYSDYRTIKTALLLLPKCMWDGNAGEDDYNKRKEIRETLVAEFADEKQDFEQYIRSVSNETIESIGLWWE